MLLLIVERPDHVPAEGGHDDGNAYVLDSGRGWVRTTPTMNHRACVSVLSTSLALDCESHTARRIALLHSPLQDAVWVLKAL